MSNLRQLPKVVFLDRGTLSPQTVLKTLPFHHKLEVFEDTAPDEVAQRIADADVVITNKVKVTGSAITSAPHLRLIAIAATGTDNVDLAKCRKQGITVCNIRGYAVNTVPEHTFALIFALRRSIIAYHESVRRGRWSESGKFCFFDHPIRDLAGSTIGIIGDGVLGQAVGEIAKALKLTVKFASHKGRSDMGPLYTPFDEVLKTSDIITLHCPLLPETRNLLDWAEFSKMERKPLIINTARGGLVNEHALARALREGLVSGAGFDVATEEPPTAEHPFQQLLDLPNFILTPHVAWASDEAIQSLADQLVDNITHFWNGTPRNEV